MILTTLLFWQHTGCWEQAELPPSARTLSGEHWRPIRPVTSCKLMPRRPRIPEAAAELDCTSNVSTGSCKHKPNLKDELKVRLTCSTLLQHWMSPVLQLPELPVGAARAGRAKRVATATKGANMVVELVEEDEREGDWCVWVLDCKAKSDCELRTLCPPPHRFLYSKMAVWVRRYAQFGMAL